MDPLRIITFHEPSNTSIVMWYKAMTSTCWTLWLLFGRNTHSVNVANGLLYCHPLYIYFTQCLSLHHGHVV